MEVLQTSPLATWVRRRVLVPYPVPPAHFNTLRRTGCITISWSLGREQGTRGPIRRPGLLEEDAAQHKQRVEIFHIPPHPRAFNACGGNLFARTLDGPGADKEPSGARRAVAHPRRVLVEVVKEGGEGGSQSEEALQGGDPGLHFVRQSQRLALLDPGGQEG